MRSRRPPCRPLRRPRLRRLRRAHPTSIRSRFRPSDPTSTEIRRNVLAVKVFQVDRGSELEPLDAERAAIAAAGGELIVADCTSEDEVLEKAGDAEIFWV